MFRIFVLTFLEFHDKKVVKLLNIFHCFMRNEKKDIIIVIKTINKNTRF